MISSACARASRSARAVLVEQAGGLGARPLGRSRSTPRSRRWRLSSASVIAGHAHLRRTKSATRNASSVQIISPTFGLTRKLESLLGAGGAARE
jgi:hypothetical protein